jgi:hypothetical protein
LPTHHDGVHEGVKGVSWRVERFDDHSRFGSAEGVERDPEAVVVEHFAHSERLVIDEVRDRAPRNDTDAALDHGSGTTSELHSTLPDRAHRFPVHIAAFDVVDCWNPLGQEARILEDSPERWRVGTRDPDRVSCLLPFMSSDIRFSFRPSVTPKGVKKWHRIC